MNLVEVYVTKIYSEKIHQKNMNTVFELVVDTDCYGQKENRKTIWVSVSDYNMIREKGYYLA